MSTARLGGDGSSISPMDSLSAFMYAPLRMLPASVIADRSSGPMSFEVPGARRSMSSARRIAVRFEKTSSVLFFNDTATTEIYTLSLHDAHLRPDAGIEHCRRGGTAFPRGGQ